MKKIKKGDWYSVREAGEHPDIIMICEDDEEANIVTEDPYSNRLSDELQTLINSQIKDVPEVN